MLISLTKHKLYIGVWALLAAIFLLPQVAHAAPNAVTVPIDLCATAGSETMPDGVTVKTLGYTLGDCAGSPTAELPGPTLAVTEGDRVEVTLYNNIGMTTSLNFPGQAIKPDLVGVSMTLSKTYVFTATDPGVFLYEAGLSPNTQHQVAMGMYGALLVRPAAAANQVYVDASTAFTTEAVIVLSEIDPDLNNSLTPETFDMRTYKARYRLINGKAYPDTEPIAIGVGDTLALRYINAGLEHHSLTTLGLQQTILGMDGNPLAHPYTVAAETMAPGETLDVLVQIPATLTTDMRYALYAGDLLLRNRNTAGFGGMMTFLSYTPGVVSTDTTGPAVQAPTLTPNPTDGTVDVTVAATVSDAATGNANVTAAEFYIDDTASTPIAMTGAFASPTESVSGIIDTATLAGLAAGNHTIYIRGQDSVGNWGTFNFAVLNLDKVGPATTSLSLAPNPSGGNVGVTLTGAADDSATGNSNIIAAEYFVDAPSADGTGIAMNLNGGTAVVGIDAVIPAGLSEGVHPIHVHGQDAFGHWGAFSIIDLYVDQTGPTAVGFVAAPNPNNGANPINPSQPAVRVDVTISDTTNAGVLSTIQTAEFFIDYQGPATDLDGTGVPMTPNDGLFDSIVENAYAFIPLPTVNALSEGPHTLAVHGLDASGNWGAIVSIPFIIDKTAPTLANVAVAPNPTDGATSVTLTADAYDDATEITYAEWFVDVDPGLGNGLPMSITPDTINGGYDLEAIINIITWVNGDYTLYVRARDGAGNWTPTGNVVLHVTNSIALYGLYFSTVGNASVPGVAGPYDSSDVYNWNGAAFARIWDASADGGLGAANVDGLAMLNHNQFYLSFALEAGTAVPGLGLVQDEDIVYYDNGAWSLWFDGSVYGLTADQHDVDAFDIADGVLYFSTIGNGSIPGVAGPFDDADIYTWDSNTGLFGRLLDASTIGMPTNADVDGFSIVGADDVYFSFVLNTGTTLPAPLGLVQDESVVHYNIATQQWSMYFAGTPEGLAANGQDIDGFDLP